MVEVIRFPDPAMRAIAYLSRFYPNVLPEPPAKWPWNDLLVTVTDVGGLGVYDVVLDEAALMVEISHPNQETASQTARSIAALLKQWPRQELGVYWRREISRPTWQPDDETRTPAYHLTVALAFRGVTVDVPEL